MESLTYQRRRAGAALIAGVWAVGSLLACASANAQLVPDRMYYGVSRPIPMTVTVPAGAAGDVQVKLLKPVSAEEVATAKAAAGAVDLAALFPQLWSPGDAAAPTLMYAQLVVGDTKVGPAVVLQPTVSPAQAWLPDARNTRDIRWIDSQSLYSGIRAYVDKDVVMTTTAGDIRFSFRPDQAPNTVMNFRQLVDGGFYTDIAFHRILAQGANGRGFVIQGGDPTGRGDGGPGYQFDLERSRLPHDFGILSMARTPEPNSNGSQFFICLSREATAGLDDNYAAFGYAIAGTEAIQSLAATPVKDAKIGNPIDAPRIKSAKLVDAAPYGTGPGALKQPPPTGAAPAPAAPR